MNYHHSQLFSSREEAGRGLAQRLGRLTGHHADLVLAIPNGGVPVGVEIAKVLGIPFDVLLMSAITAPGCGRTPLGAITRDGVRMLDCATIDRLHLSKQDVNNAILKQCQELARLGRLYRGPLPSEDVADRTVILADDGTTPCTTLRNAVRLLRRQHAEHVIVALPAACHHTACDLRLEADEVVTLVEPAAPIPAGKWFRHFPRTTKAEVRQLLVTCHQDPASHHGDGHRN